MNNKYNKFVWSSAFEHTETGIQILFYEWKGGFTFGARDFNGQTNTPTNKKFIGDCLELLNFLISNKCPHPYDGCVAGSVA